MRWRIKYKIVRNLYKRLMWRFFYLENCYGGDKMIRDGDNWLYDGDKVHQVSDKLFI